MWLLWILAGFCFWLGLICPSHQDRKWKIGLGGLALFLGLGMAAISGLWVAVLWPLTAIIAGLALRAGWNLIN